MRAVVEESPRYRALGLQQGTRRDQSGKNLEEAVDIGLTVVGSSQGDEPRSQLQVDIFPEQPTNMDLVSPEQWRLGDRRWRGEMTGHGSEHVAHVPLGVPRGQPDAPSRSKHPHDLTCRHRMTRGEHHTEGGQDHVE